VSITGTTRVAAVLGWPVEHSCSPILLNAAFAAARVDAVLVPVGVPPDGLSAVIAGLRAMRMLGASVTVPHKLGVAEHCDVLSPAAREIGAVNCLALEGSRLVGHNTDAPGFADALAAAGFDARGKRCVLLGAGGAARAVAHALTAAQLDVIARRPEDTTWTRAQPWRSDVLTAAFARADLVVDCTPAGLAAASDAAFVDALPLEALPESAWIATLVYHRRTSLLERARTRGHSTLDGRGMLVHQGARAFEIWTGLPAPLAVMRRALDEALDRTVH
jgi:shikimate dehydrogenase